MKKQYKNKKNPAAEVLLVEKFMKTKYVEVRIEPWYTF